MEEEGNIFQAMAEKWPSNVVARTQVPTFTGGLMTEKYQANLDSLGKGPEGALRVGRKVIYPVNNYVKWLAGRSSVIPKK